MAEVTNMQTFIKGVKKRDIAGVMSLLRKEHGVKLLENNGRL